MMNQISQWSFQHPILAALIAYLVIVARENLEKLASRQQRGVIDGNGDER